MKNYFVFERRRRRGLPSWILRSLQRIILFQGPEWVQAVLVMLKCVCIEKFSCKKTLLFERTLEIIYTNSLQLFRIISYFVLEILRFKWLLWDSELGWWIVMRCFSKWRTIPDKQRKIYLARLGFEPATFGLLVRCSTNWATGQVGSWSSNDGTWAIWYFETESRICLICKLF